MDLLDQYIVRPMVPFLLPFLVEYRISFCFSWYLDIHRTIDSTSVRLLVALLFFLPVKTEAKLSQADHRVTLSPTILRKPYTTISIAPPHQHDKDDRLRR